MLENIKNKLENAVYDYLDKHAILDPDEVFESPNGEDAPEFKKDGDLNV